MPLALSVTHPLNALRLCSRVLQTLRIYFVFVTDLQIYGLLYGKCVGEAAAVREAGFRPVLLLRKDEQTEDVHVGIQPGLRASGYSPKKEVSTLTGEWFR